ncbi:hypothetical protein SARC_01048 [Sphaeroforma arctica JP610]|uniref:Lipid droplet-associated hydrolase n=1 Tax=Sphaeroforma arctica JP610 TaxID=667725 RepID=A0A0L0GD49_9EUKA|nr:hypothetical protein SARC_01048 [Sphaeroforma arctica JP610]KNC86816.1 hypothetical protein SARC_01048 [Sphaeroforma arctica JP610]|eukprot:XP_014160718.1 hypothetical protein SARC_01048 [Sphaeroforma arctica JP610]
MHRFKKEVITIGASNIVSSLHTLEAVVKPKLCVFVTPGNPGVIDFYHKYMLSLYESANCKVEVCGLSLAGHAPGLDNQGRLFTLQQQIEHKEDYLTQKLQANPDLKVVLVGHSVGAYIMLHTLEKLAPERVAGYWGLYPTIQHIGASPNGVRLTPLFEWYNLIGYTASWLQYLPLRIKKTIVRPFVKSGEETNLDVVASLINYSTAANAISMAKEEMANILDIDESIIHDHGDKMTFFFAEGDEWAPVSHYHDMTERFPKSQILLCENNTHHGFVVFDEEADLMGKLSCAWLDHLL